MGRALAVEMNGHHMKDGDTPFAMGGPKRYSITQEFKGATVLVTGEAVAITQGSRSSR